MRRLHAPLLSHVQETKTEKRVQWQRFVSVQIQLSHQMLHSALEQCRQGLVHQPVVAFCRRHEAGSAVASTRTSTQHTVQCITYTATLSTIVCGTCATWIYLLLTVGTLYLSTLQPMHKLAPWRSTLLNLSTTNACKVLGNRLLMHYCRTQDVVSMLY